MSTTVSSLNESEETFYAAAAKGWEQCSLEQKAFVAFNSTYTPGYITATQQALQAAKELPNLEARQAVEARMRVLLEGALKTTNSLVQDLYTIIGRSFPDNQVESMRSEAGSGYYEAATQGNWNSADTLYTMVSTFLVTYLTDLINGKMPADFPARFEESKAVYYTAFTNYSKAKDNISKGGTAKQNANSAAYTLLMQMLSDGKRVFDKDPAMKKYFTYSSLKKMVSGPGKTGIRFKLQEEVSLIPVSNSTITMQPGNHTLYADNKGIATQLMPAGKYSYTITTPGMKTLTGEVKITTGSMRHLSFILEKALLGEKAAPTETTSTKKQNHHINSVITAVNSQPPTVYRQQSTVNSQLSIVDSRPSTVDHQRLFPQPPSIICQLSSIICRR